MAATRCDTDLIELRMEKECPRGILSTRRRPVDPHPFNIYVWVLLGGGLDPEDAILKAGVFEILPTDIVKGFGPVGCSHAVNLNHNEAQLGQ